MDNTQISTRKYFEAVAWGLLSILWGVTILFRFIPFGAGLVGTGLVLLGANLFCMLNGFSAKSDNTVLGILAIAWGGLELARPILRLMFESADLDWVIFAILLIGLGLILLLHSFLRLWKSIYKRSKDHVS